MNNLMIYGSHARDDYIEDSDVDLISLTENNTSKKIIKNKINLSIYSITKIQDMAISGSLFVYHLKTEGKILYDENDIFNDLLNNKFLLKQNYSIEKYFSYDLLKEISSIYNTTSNITFAHSKIIWCLRTIFASIGAENNKPIFSRDSINQEFGKEASEFTKLKNSQKENKNKIIKIIKFIETIVDLKDYSQIIYSDELLNYKDKVLNTLKNEKINSSSDFY